MHPRIQVLVMYSDKNQWIIPAFLRHWGTYAGIQDYNLVLCGYDRAFNYPVAGYYIGKQADYPANRWSDALIKVLDNVAEPTFILLLEDYLLNRQVDNAGVRYLYEYTRDRNYVLKADLTMDRLWSGGGNRYLWGYNTYGRCGHLDLIRSFVGTDYQMSLWGGIFNRDTLRRFLVPGETAQQIELNGTGRVNQVGDEVLVIGTRQGPMMHTNIVQGGGLNYHETVGLPALTEDERNYVLELLRSQ